LAYLVNDLILPEWLYDFSHNKLTGYTYYDYDGSNWQNDGMKTYYYSNVTISVSEVYNNAYTVYPNPATEFVTFDISNTSADALVSIYSLEGVKILSQQLSNKTVNISTLQKGMYLYQINAGGKISTGKLIVE
jgi:hypothetical protein